jgi:hypothetical protein
VRELFNARARNFLVKRPRRKKNLIARDALEKNPEDLS